jgi:hypothetical protein
MHNSQKLFVGSLRASRAIKNVIFWISAPLKGLAELKDFILAHFSLLFLTQKCQFQDSRF